MFLEYHRATLELKILIHFFSLEIRVPFLDQQFVHYYLNLPKDKIRPKEGVEKFLIRSAFDNTDLLPEHILWRHKEAFR